MPIPGEYDPIRSLFHNIPSFKDKMLVPESLEKRQEKAWQMH